MKRIPAIAGHLEEILCAAILLAMAVITGANIITRCIPGLSFAASEELVVNLFVWLTMLGAVVAVKQGAHISITFVQRRVSEQYRRLFLLLQWGAVCTVFVLLAYYGCLETWAEYRIRMMTYSLGWPLWFFTLAIPVGGLLVVIRFTQLTIREWRAYR
ncbi:MAG: TRAP transporter small permease [bacterium]